MADDIERLLSFGRMGLETGYYEQARDSFEQVLALDPSNREAIEGLGQANEMLRRMESVQSVRRVESAPRAEPAPRVEPAPRFEPAQQEPVRPPPTVEPQPTVPEWRTPEWRGTPGIGFQEQPRLGSEKEDSMEFGADENLEWLSLQLKHVPIKTWTIVFAKMGVAWMFLMSLLAIIAVVAWLVLAKIDINIMEVLGDLL